MSLATTYLQSVIKRFNIYKELGEKTFEQLSNEDFHFKPNEESNSIAVIIQHMAGNMLSRWTDFLTSDGEKEWRSRDNEFNNQNLTKSQKGWDWCLNTLNSVAEGDLLKTIHIRSQELIAIDAINRQLTHYPSHVGQIMYIGKIIKNKNWQSLSIAKGQSDDYNQQMNAKG